MAMDSSYRVHSSSDCNSHKTFTYARRERFRLRYGHYRTPRFRYGKIVQDARKGKVKIVGLSDAPIPWPIGLKYASRSPVLYGAQIKAVRLESNQAVARAWGVSGQTVTAWRKALNVPVTTVGTRALRSAHFREIWPTRMRAGSLAKVRDPERRAKIAAARRGKPRPPEVVEAMRKARLGTRASRATRRRMSETQKRRWVDDPRKWSAEEDALIATLPASEAAKRTGRTVYAVKFRRRRLGLPDGRTKPARQVRAV
jgi:hypothetical protein